MNNFIAILPTIMNLKGNQDQFGFAGTHEYTLIYCKNKKYAKFKNFYINEEELLKWEEDDYGFFKEGANLKATGKNAPREKRENLFFPIFIKPDNNIYIADNDKKNNKDAARLLPITSGKEMSWRWSKEKIMRERHNIIVKRRSNNITLYKKQRPSLGDLPSKKPKTLFYKPEYSSGNGTNLLKEMFGKKVFDNPKPLELIKDLLILTTKEDSIILDFTAGSGTTGHAILELNKDDNNNRKFILCTNNENKICTEVCYPRLKMAIEGYQNSKGIHINGLKSNLKYFKTDFVDSESTDSNKKKLTEKATEMLCIKEGTFKQILNDEKIKIFKNGNQYTGIIFDQLEIPRFKNTIKKIEGKFNVYIFSLGGDIFEEEFTDISNKVKLSPIPEAILKVYRRIFK